MPSPCNKSLAFVFLIYQLPLILSTTPSYSNVFSPGFGISSVSLQLFTSYLSSRTSTVGIPPYSSPSSPLTCGVPQAPFSAQFCSIFISLLLALSSVLLSLTFYMLMTHNSSYLLFLQISRLPLTTFSSLSLSFHLACLLTILLSIHLKLNSFLSVSLSKPLK